MLTHVATAVVVSVVYAVTAFRTMPGGDSGELVASGCELTTSHPPGYPLYTMLVALAVRFIPVSSVALRANLLSCVLGGIAAGLVSYTVQLILTQPLPPTSKTHSTPSTVILAAGVFAAGCFSFNPLVWMYSHGAEVFALNNCLCAWLLAAAMRWARNPTARNLYVGVMVAGLGMANQHTSILFTLPIAAFIAADLWMEGKLEFGRIVRVVATALLSSLLPYLYLSISQSIHMTPSSWGLLTTFPGLLRHFLRADYGTMSLLDRDFDDLGVMRRIGYYFHHLTFVAGPFGIVAFFAILGAWVIISLPIQPTQPLRDRMPQGLLLAWLFSVLIFHTLGAFPLTQPLWYDIFSRFWMQPTLIVSIAAGVGVWSLGRVGGEARKEERNSWMSKWIVGGVGVGVGVLFLRAVPVTMNKHNTAVGMYGAQLLQKAFVNSTWAVVDDTQLTASRFLSACEKMRPDVSIFSVPLNTYRWTTHVRTSATPNLVYPGAFVSTEGSFDCRLYGGVATELRELGEANLARIPFHYTGSLSRSNLGMQERMFARWPVGLNVLLAPNAHERRLSIPHLNLPQDDPRMPNTSQWANQLPFDGGFVKFQWRIAAAGILDGEEDLILSLPRERDVVDFAKWGMFDWGRADAVAFGGGDLDIKGKLREEHDFGFEDATTTWFEAFTRTITAPLHLTTPSTSPPSSPPPLSLPPPDEYGGSFGDPNDVSTAFSPTNLPPSVRGQPRHCLAAKSAKLSWSNPANHKPLISEGSWEWRAVVYVRVRLQSRILAFSESAEPTRIAIDRSLRQLQKWLEEEQVDAALNDPEHPNHATTADLVQSFRERIYLHERLLLFVNLMTLRDAELLATVSPALHPIPLRALITTLYNTLLVAKRHPEQHIAFLQARMPFHCLDVHPTPSRWHLHANSFLLERIQEYKTAEKDPTKVAQIQSLVPRVQLRIAELKGE